MAYGNNRIVVCRERDSYCVTVTDPAIQAANDKNNSKSYDGPSQWQDPDVDYDFTDKAQVLAFLDKAMDIALPEDDYSSAFDKLAKDAKDVE